MSSESTRHSGAPKRFDDQLGGLGDQPPSTGELCFLTGGTLRALNKELEGLVRFGGARCALVIDRTGCILASEGEHSPFPQTELANAVRASVEALGGLSERCGGSGITISLHGGSYAGIHMTRLGNRAHLAAVFTAEEAARTILPAVAAAAERIAPLLEDDLGRRRQLRGHTRKKHVFGEEISDLFMDHEDVG